MDERSATSKEEVDLAPLVMTLWRHRKVILLFVALASLLGLVYSLLVPSIYSAQAVIALKEHDRSDASRLAQLGGVGGLFAAQLGGGNSLERVAVMLKSRDLIEFVVVENDLMPQFHRKSWDPASGTWKEGKKVPSLRKTVEDLKRNSVHVTTDVKKGLLFLTVDAPDSLLAKRFVEAHLDGLNQRIRSDAMKAADANRAYLEEQMARTVDPILLEKIQNLASYEIEKSMLASSHNFDVLESPAVPMVRKSPKRKQLVILAGLLGFLLSAGGVFAWRGAHRLRLAMARADAA